MSTPGMSTAEAALHLIAWWTVTILAYQVVAYWITVTYPDDAHEEVEPPHLGGTRRLAANDHPITEENVA